MIDTTSANPIRVIQLSSDSIMTSCLALTGGNCSSLHTFQSMFFFGLLFCFTQVFWLTFPPLVTFWIHTSVEDGHGFVDASCLLFHFVQECIFAAWTLVKGLCDRRHFFSENFRQHINCCFQSNTHTRSATNMNLLFDTCINPFTDLSAGYL